MSPLDPRCAKLPPASRGIAVFCALTVWLLGLFAAGPLLHGTLHDDAAHTGHSCAITVFRGGIDGDIGTAVIVVTPALFPAGETVAVSAVPMTAADVRLPPGCGPPRC